MSLDVHRHFHDELSHVKVRLLTMSGEAEAALGLAHYLSGDAGGARSVWEACLARRPENARVDAYLAMLSRAGQ